MKSRFDYTALEGRAKVLQDEVTTLTAKAETTPTDRDRIMGLMGEIHALEETAAQMKDAELVELREMVARQGAPIGEPSAEVQVERDFRAYLRTGEIRNASMSTTDANGGYLVPEPLHAQMIEKVRLSDPIFGNATLFHLTGDTTLMLPYKSAHGVVANATETGARSEQNAPTLTSPTLVCYDYYSDQRASQQYLDSVVGAEDMLMGWMFEDIQEQAGADAVNGSGTTKIKGLFAETSAYTTKLSTSAGAILNTNFLTLYFALPVKFRKNAKWIMSGATLATAAAFADPAASTSPLCKQDVAGNWTIYGKGVLESDSAPAIGAANYPIAFADIAAAYAVGIHRSTTILRDPYTATPKVRFYSLARLGGCAWNYQAALLLKSNNS